MPKPAKPAIDPVGLLFALSGLLRSSWRRFSAHDRDRLLTDLVSIAAMLRNDLKPSRADGPTVEDVRAQLMAPTGQVEFQPIVWLPTAEVVGFEALSLFVTWPPDRWFDAAWEGGVGLELELQAVERALSTLASIPDDVYLAVNVSPITLLSSQLATVLRTSEPHRIVLELTEHERIREYGLYREQLTSLRRLGTRIAVDDAGAGHSSLRHIIQLGPDIIKLDRALTTDCDKDPVRRALMTCLATFASETRTSLVAEGIETAEQAAALVSYGVAFGQGFYFGRPGPQPTLETCTDTGGRMPMAASAGPMA